MIRLLKARPDRWGTIMLTAGGVAAAVAYYVSQLMGGG